jgi:hypothetical protein
MENSQKAPNLTEEKNEIFNQSKIQWEIPKFEEIELESGKFLSPPFEDATYRTS